MPPVTRPEDRLAAPPWLARAGTVSWLTLGVIGLGAALTVALSTFSTIVFPIIFAAVAAALALPLVDALARHGVPRSLGALLGLTLVVSIAGGVVALISWSLYDQREEISAAIHHVVDEIVALLEELDFDATAFDDFVENLSSLVSERAGGLVSNALSVASGAFLVIIGVFFSLVFLFFLLRDGPMMARWLQDRISPQQRVHLDTAGSSAITALRQYFTGRAAVAAVDSVLIGAAAWVLDVPLVSAIVVLTFVGGFVPYIGAITAGALAVILALASQGVVVALIMLAVVLVVQNIIEPLVEARVLGGQLGLHPMLVIIVTTVGGLAVGLTGLVLAAPLTSATVKFVSQLRANATPPSGTSGESSSQGHDPPPDPDPSQPPSGATNPDE